MKNPDIWSKNITETQSSWISVLCGPKLIFIPELTVLPPFCIPFIFVIMLMIYAVSSNETILHIHTKQMTK
jgi:hypothetical protein